LVFFGGVLGTVAHGKLVVHVKETVSDERVLRGGVAESGILTGKQEAERISAVRAEDWYIRQAKGEKRGRTEPATCSPYLQRP
jgi:hypothetical protein